MASGGDDASVVVWRDVTADKVAAAEAEEEELVMKQQELSNALAVSFGRPGSAEHYTCLRARPVLCLVKHAISTP